MKQTCRVQSLASVVLLIMQISHAFGGTHFTSHVTVNTPARSYSHGVGNPMRLGIPFTSHRTSGRRSLKYRSQVDDSSGGRGYSRTKPTLPFHVEDGLTTTEYRTTPYLHNNFGDDLCQPITSTEVSISLLPPSPYRVNSPDPESLWPEGLFLPPIRPVRFRPNLDRRVDDYGDDSCSDPYFVEGSEAVAAVQRAQQHGVYYFHDIPHTQSLLAHQQLRRQNNLDVLRIASIRHTWPYNRN